MVKLSLNYLQKFIDVQIFSERIFSLSLTIITFLFSGEVFSQEPPFSYCSKLDQSNNIRDYLSISSKEVSESFFNGIKTLENWEDIREQRYQEFLEMMSLSNVPMTRKRSPLNIKKTGTIQMKGYRIEKIYYESLPELYVPAALYIPDGITNPVPAILYLCGHARNQKVYYQGLARKFAQLGFVCMIIETVQWGEVLGEHWGAYDKGWFHWYSRGYTPGGVELWNGIRGLDLLSQLPEVDKENIGVTGASGGGSQSWYIAAADPRVKAAAPAAGGETLEAEIQQKTIDDHCDCMFPINTYKRDFADIGALIAPRPLMIAAPNRDGLFAIESVRKLKEDVDKVYNLYNASENLSLIESEGGHGDRGTLRPQIFSFFIKHLMGKNISPDEIGDIDKSPEAQLSEDDLRVYIEGAPKNDRTTSIQDSFLAIAQPPLIENEKQLSIYRAEVLNFLKDKTFNAFPRKPEPLDMKMEVRKADDAAFGVQTFSFVSEKGWRLKFTIHWNQPREKEQPILLVLRNPREARNSSENFIDGLDKNVSVAYFEARGIGETGWAPELQWHVRRASAWTGRTVASMRVYDVLRCLEALRKLPGVNNQGISIATRGEMSAIAIYASFLDKKINTLIVKSPPESQNTGSQPDGRGEAIEMLNCLRITDLAQVAGLVLTTKFIGIGELPETYNWTKSVYKKFNPDYHQMINDFSEWKN